MLIFRGSNMEKTDIFYNYNKIISYNAFLNFLIGERRRWEKLWGYKICN